MEGSRCGRLVSFDCSHRSTTKYLSIVEMLSTTSEEDHRQPLYAIPGDLVGFAQASRTARAWACLRHTNETTEASRQILRAETVLPLEKRLNRRQGSSELWVSILNDLDNSI